MKLLVLVSTSATAAAWESPLPEKYQELVSACKGLSALTNCSAVYSGTCQSSANGNRFCAHAEPEAASFGWSVVHAFKDKVKSALGHDSAEGQPLGDCGRKADGEACAASRHGHCVPTGKCPVFEGKIVCKPWGSRPPSFITEPCEGKQDGDACRLMLLSGKCMKSKYDDSVVCKAWPFSKDHEEHQQVDAAFDKVNVVV
eukprot:CAMPEP_0171095916 /NCGR_PEP_ID=MMETSP0766_2-20121228/43445_1 /TAXON_ID=439317 /ORGANISM="Gambierdiscus australes, Strain CAWD 149" /LENGTH=199 /DNA_ID=CAMNT_0011554789 /DNA_START=78 /DNA_END=677 /DNA_ORIENTATION=-